MYRVVGLVFRLRAFTFLLLSSAKAIACPGRLRDPSLVSPAVALEGVIITLRKVFRALNLSIGHFVERECSDWWNVLG